MKSNDEDGTDGLISAEGGIDEGSTNELGSHG